MKDLDLGYFKENVKTTIASSPWLLIDQSLINNFANLTGDTQWIHTDPKRAKKESPYKKTIAHGYLLLSLIPQLVQQTYSIKGLKTKINYGLNKVRFLLPVKVDEKIRAHFFIEECEEINNDYIKVEIKVSLEIESSKELACIANLVALYQV